MAFSQRSFLVLTDAKLCKADALLTYVVAQITMANSMYRFASEEAEAAEEVVGQLPRLKKAASLLWDSLKSLRPRIQALTKRLSQLFTTKQTRVKELEGELKSANTSAARKRIRQALEAVRSAYKKTHDTLMRPVKFLQGKVKQVREKHQKLDWAMKKLLHEDEPKHSVHEVTKKPGRVSTAVKNLRNKHRRIDVALKTLEKSKVGRGAVAVGHGINKIKKPAFIWGPAVGVGAYEGKHKAKEKFEKEEKEREHKNKTHPKHTQK